MICKKRKFIFIDITKTAGSSIRKALSGSPRPKRHHSIRNIFESHKFCSTLTKDQIENYYKFTIVRNPYDRIVSFWRYMRVIKNKLHNISFEDFLLKIEDGEFSRRELCYTPMINWVIDNNDKIAVDFIGRFESLDKDFRKICEKINVKYRPLEKICSSGDREPCWAYYNERTKNIVDNMYKKDFEIFNYKWKGW